MECDKVKCMNEYRRSIEEYKQVMPIKRKIGVYWALAILRIALTFIPQSGYVHPDEYFQSIEVIAGDHFDIDVYKPWEFNATFPIRSVFISQMVVGIPYSILRRLTPYTFYYFGISLRTPYFIVLFPRLLMCLLSFVSDYCLYKICCMYGQNYKVRLITLASSYVTLVYMTRVFSNSVEVMLTSLLLYYTSTCMAYSEKIIVQSDYLSDEYDKAKTGVERVKYYKLKASLPAHSLEHCFKMATITVIGIFNRPTFIAFALPPVFFWLQRGLGSKSVGFLDFHIRIFTFAVCTLPTVIFFILVDSFYFGYLTMGEIGNLDISMNNFVVTPLNFLKYNLNTKNLEIHGLHPRFLHFLINVPLLFNVLGILGLFTVCKILYSGLKGRWLDMPRIQSIVGLMTVSFAMPIALLSIFPHQEPRFIIPVTLPLVFLYAPQINQVPGVDTVAIPGNNKTYHTSSNQRHKPGKFEIAWYICNICLCLFYGFAHQAGVFPLSKYLTTELKAKPDLTHIHLYTSYTYPIPTALLSLRNTRRTYVSSSRYKYRLVKDFYHYEKGSTNVTEVYDEIAAKLNECEEKFIQKRIPYRLYYALPFTAMDEFLQHLEQNNSLNYYPVAKFFPHVSTERLPSLQDLSDLINLSYGEIYKPQILLEISNRVSNLFKQFGLMLIKIEPKRKSKMRRSVRT